MKKNTKHKFAYVLPCGDPKISRALMRIFDRRFGGRENYFWMPAFGGVKKISSPAKRIQTESVFEDIETAQKVHPFGLIIVINHSNCGAYRLAGVTFDDPAKETAHHRKELNRAIAKLLERFPRLEVETHYFLKKEQRLTW